MTAQRRGNQCRLVPGVLSVPSPLLFHSFHNVFVHCCDDRVHHVDHPSKAKYHTHDSTEPARQRPWSSDADHARAQHTLPLSLNISLVIFDGTSVVFPKQLEGPARLCATRSAKAHTVSSSSDNMSSFFVDEYPEAAKEGRPDIPGI